MLNYLVGPVDSSGAFVLAVLFAMIAIIVVAITAKYQSRVEEQHKFDLAAMKESSEDRVRIKQEVNKHEIAMARIAADREVEFKRIDSGLIELKALNETGK